MTAETRLKQLTDEFDRLTRTAEEHGYAQFRERLEELSREIKDEELNQRLFSNVQDAVELYEETV